MRCMVSDFDENDPRASRAAGTPVTVRELLIDQTREELDRMAWPAFTEQVMARLGDGLPADLEQAAVEQLRRDVDAEVTGFDGAAFRDGIEAQIFSQGMRAPTPWDRLVNWAEKVWTPVRAPVLVAGAAAVAVALTVGLGPTAGTATAGGVTVDELTVEGTATVVSAEGMTVVWLADS